MKIKEVLKKILLNNFSPKAQSVLLSIYRRLKRWIFSVVLDFAQAPVEYDDYKLGEVSAGGYPGMLSIIYVCDGGHYDLKTAFNAIGEGFELICVIPKDISVDHPSLPPSIGRRCLIASVPRQDDGFNAYVELGLSIATGELCTWTSSLKNINFQALSYYRFILSSNPQLDVVYGRNGFACRRWVGVLSNNYAAIANNENTLLAPLRIFPPSSFDIYAKPPRVRSLYINGVDNTGIIRTALSRRAAEQGIELLDDAVIEKRVPQAAIFIDSLNISLRILHNKKVNKLLILTEEVDERALRSPLIKKSDIIITDNATNFFILKNAARRVLFMRKIEERLDLILWALGNAYTKPPMFPVIRVSQKANVLFETRSFDKGGLEQVVFDLVSNINRQAFNVSVVCTEKAGELASKCKARGIPVFLASDVEAYDSILADCKPDVINTHYSSLGIAVANKRDVPVVDVLHNSYVWFSPAECAAYTSRNSSTYAYIAVSHNAATYARRYLGVTPDKLRIIPNGFDLQRYEKGLSTASSICRETLGISKSDYVFLNVASLSYLKGHNVMMAALDRLSSYPELKILCVAHSIDPEYAKYFHARQPKYRGRLLYMESVSPDVMKDLYALADAFLLPSLVEGWSISAMEAMYFGLPLILTDVGGADHLIEDGDIGIVIPNSYGEPTALNAANLHRYATESTPANTGELVKAMLDFYRNQSEWRLKGQRGKEKLRMFDIKNTVSAYEQIYIEALRNASQHSKENLYNA